MHIVLVDDEPFVRSALRLLIEHDLGIPVVHEVTAAEALAALPPLAAIPARHRGTADSSLSRIGECKDTALLLIDWELPGLNPRLHLEPLRRHCPGLKIVALSGRPDARPEALAAGVDAFLYRGDPPDQLLNTLRSLAEQETLM